MAQEGLRKFVGVTKNSFVLRGCW